VKLLVDHNLVIVSKDADFHQLSFTRGHPQGHLDSAPQLLDERDRSNDPQRPSRPSRV
jgi:hypothetical protein